MEVIRFISDGHEMQGVWFEPTPGSRPGMTNTSAVILCHGAFEDHQNWSTYAERLAGQGFATLALDFVGHGESQGLRGLVGMKPWAYNIREAMNELGRRGYRHFALVGWNLGGSAVLLTAAHDQRLACVVVLSAPIRILPGLGERAAYTLAAAASKVLRLIRKRPLTFSRLDEYTRRRFAVNDSADSAYKNNPQLREILRAVPFPESLDSVWVDISAAIPKIKAPVLVIHGGCDTILPVQQSKTLYTLLPGVKKLVLVDDSGHALHLDQKKDEVYVAIASWIKHYLG